MGDTTNQGEPFIKNEGIIFCHHCHVPLDVHGTCCGWLNAASKTNTEWVITDSRHPGFGQNLNDWKHNALMGNFSQKL